MKGNENWAVAAIEHELGVLGNLPEENPNKPGSQFSIALLKIASVAKGDGRTLYNSDKLLAAITATINGRHGLNENEIKRQWTRAWNKAKPRYRNSNSNVPGVTVAMPDQLTPAQIATAAAAGIDVRNPKTTDYRKAFIALGYDFAMNELDDSVWANGQRLDDGMEAVLRNRCRDWGLTSTGRIKDAMIQFSYENKFHPIKQYLESLVWDGNDWINLFVAEFLEETTGLGPAAFKRWLVGSVAKIYEQGQNFMLVWDGPQGIGKSTLARWLCPLPRFFIEGPIRPDDKDSLIRLASKWIWEVGELQATTRRSDKEALKGFISTEEVTVRRPYSANDMIKPAMASLIGTINEDGAGFLSDPTGNRRFVIIHLQRIDHRYTELNQAQIWAQAMALYRSGCAWRLNQEETQMQMAINSQYETDSIVALLFHELFEIVDDPNQFCTANDILAALDMAGLRGNQQANMNELGRIMKRLGIEKFRARIAGQRPVAYRKVRKV